MSYLNWNNAFVTGIEIVDQQHQRLVDMLNQLAELLLNSATINQQDAKGLIDGLVSYVAEHFSTEERLMQQFEVDPRHSQHHVHSHRDFANKVSYTLEQFSKDQSLSGVELLQFLSNWLIFHILGEDQKMAREIEAIQSGLSPSQAYDAVQGSDAEISSSANDVLVNALVSLYAQLSKQQHLLIQQNANIANAHAELDRYRQILEQQVSLKTTELRQTNAALLLALDKANAASTAKTRFLAVISHELLTPINVILGFASLIEHAEIPDKQRGQAKKISQAGKELNSLLNEVLTYSRLDANELNIEAVIFLPGALLSIAVDRMKAQAREKNLELNHDAEPNFPCLLGDEEHLRQAVEILLSNAIKYTDQGSVNLTAKQLEATVDRVKVEFAIQDTGIGIPLERQKDLFQQFEQLNSSLSRKHKGIGLGLVICSRLVSLMGGELTFESQPGFGSTFRITLWLQKDQSTTNAVYQQGSALDPATIDSDYREIERLEKLLSEGDLEARQLFLQLTPRLAHQLSPESFSTLTEHIQSYQFDQALHTLLKAVSDCGQSSG